MAHYALALDVGGTFTDVMLMHRASGQLWTVKPPSTPADPSAGFFQGMQKMLHLAGIAPEAVEHVLHGSTVATNTILEGKGASTGLITTEGFQYVLEIGRHDIPRRAMATVLNAYVQPVVSRYIGKLESGLRSRGLQGPLLIMASNGGVFGPQTAAQQAVHMALSGPAAGAIGAGYMGRLSGYPDVVSIDMGGTSADICLIKEGRPAVTHEGEIGPFPLHIPMTDIHTIGAGGGSIAAVTSLGSLTVGPQSAGAMPGPACYDQGGTAPTVTDANLVLGRIPPALLGGEVPLNPERARQAIYDHVAVPLDLDLYEAAAGIVQIVNNMVGALRVVSVERGYDPQPFALVAFGGAGPLHAGPLAQLLGTLTIIMPPSPGLLSALGLLATDIQHDVMRTFVQRGPHYDLAGMEVAYRALHAEAAAHLTAEGLPPERQSFQRLADLRYARQGFEVTVEFPGQEVSAPAVEQLLRDGITDQSYSVHLSLVKQNGTISLDFSGTDDQARGAVNFIMHESVPKFMYGLYLTADDPTILLNHGFARAIDAVQTRPGSLVHPIPPAPLGMRSNTMLRVNNCVFGTLALATDGQTNAASSVYVIYMLRSLNRQSGDYALCIEGLGVGLGARPFSDGPDAIYYVAQKNYPVEFAEMEFGVRIERYSIHRDSGGPGRYRGGCGIVRDVRIIADEGLLASRLENVRFPAWGVNGGHSGRPGRLVVNPGTPEERELKPLSDNNRLHQGDLLRVMTSGGGGWGHPFDRPAAQVREDVRDGFVSPASAGQDYGVVLDPQSLEVDEVKTAQRRKDRRSETTMFHRGRYLHGEER